MKNRILDIFKGIAIGIANVIPGFSGGTMAIILHCYDRIINGLSEFFSHPIKVIKDIWSLAIGLLLGIVIAIFLIGFLLIKFTLPTVLFFTGLIIGSIPGIGKEANIKSSKPYHYIYLLIALAIIIGLPFIKSNDVSSNINFGKLIIIFIMGIIAAATMIIPGVSGSLTLMAFGFYTLIITNIKDLLDLVLHFNFTNIKNPLFITLFFGVGIVLGVVLISKLIKMLLSKSKQSVYFVILGLLIGSPFSIIYTTVTDKEYSIDYGNPLNWVFGVILFILGVAIPIIMEIVSKKYLNKEEVINEESTNEDNVDESTNKEI